MGKSILQERGYMLWPKCKETGVKRKIYLDVFSYKDGTKIFHLRKPVAREHEPLYPSGKKLRNMGTSIAHWRKGPNGKVTVPWKNKANKQEKYEGYNKLSQDEWKTWHNRYELGLFKGWVSV